MNAYRLAGVDLAWISAKNSTAVAFGSLSGIELHVEGVLENLYGKNSVLNALDSIEKLHGVAIDAPLIINNETGQRNCEKSLSKDYGSRKAACHASNATKYPDADSVAISELLTSKGFNHLGQTEENWQIECYPHPALIEIFGLEERHLYKKGRVKTKKEGQIALGKMLSELRNSKALRLIIPQNLLGYLNSENIHLLRGSNLKHNEDVLDAIVCLYIAGLYQAGVTEVIYGDVIDGYIYVPTNLCAL